MRPWRLLIGLGFSAAMLLVLLVLIPLQVSSQTPTLDSVTYQLLQNPGMEVFDPPYARFDGVDCQVASAWQRFWYDAPAPCWMDTRVFANSHLGGGWVERIEGDTSQLLVSTQPYMAGLQQRVTGLVPGVGYGFHAAMLTIFQTSAPPAVDGTMIKQVGMDPTGGTDPQAPTVIWSAPDDHDEGPWDINQRTAVFAQGPAMTVFIRVESLYPSGGLPYMNLSFLDSAILAQTPTVRATSPAFSDETSFSVNWDNAVAAPVGGKLRDWHDVQWLDESEGIWHDWFALTDQVQATFSGELGHTYRFRARVWQRYPNGAHLYGPWRPEGDTATCVRGPLIVGTVSSPEGHPVAGATIAFAGTSYSAVTGSYGQYVLPVPPGYESDSTLVLSHPWWASPAPVHDVEVGPTETLTVTWTVRPPDDAVVNGEFESSLDGWSLLSEPGMAPRVVADPVHTGQGALLLGGGSATASALEPALGVTQTAVLTGAWEPVLSFWYRPAGADDGDPFHVVLTLVTQTISVTLPVTGGITSTLVMSAPITTTLTFTTTRILTPALDLNNWQHAWAYLGPPRAAITGTVTVQLLLGDDDDEAYTMVYVDEVSLGATPGGPHKVHLPIVMRRW